MKATGFDHIRHIFFDLDHTIWDFDANAYQTLVEMYYQFELSKLGIHDVDCFIRHYQKNNHELWKKYHLGQISKETLRSKRFTDTFIEMGVAKQKIPYHFDQTFVEQGPLKTQLFDGAKEILTYLSQKYPLYIISNGFKNSTYQKINGSNLKPFFKHIFVSEEIGFNKPHPKVFEHILNTTDALPENSLMIGDSLEADIDGALNVGMSAIFFNPTHQEKPNNVSHQIHHLLDLKAYF